MWGVIVIDSTNLGANRCTKISINKKLVYEISLSEELHLWITIKLM